MTSKEISTRTPSENLDYYSGRLEFNLGRIANGRRPVVSSPVRLAKWARGATHAAYALHPELREEGSLERYFVAKAGRKMGFRGEDLTWFVEKAYENGVYGRFIPDLTVR